MARYRETEAGHGQGLFLSVNLQDQLLSGSYEHMLNEIIGTTIDLSVFDKNYKNDTTGASAVPPSALLKLIIYGYLNGCISSRKIYALNNHNIIAKALTGDMYIHWTTIADFISGNKAAFEKVFVHVLMYCNELGLIGGGDYAIDGLRLPSNASKDMSGTEEQLKKRLASCEKMAQRHVERHGRQDAHGAPNDAASETQRRFEQRQRQLHRQIHKISVFLEKMEKKAGLKKAEIKSNVTDNDSALIHSSKGCIQGYIGIAVADSKTQVITSAQAVGSANEGEHFPAMLDKNAANLEAVGCATPAGKQPTMSGDAAYFTENNLKACADRGIDAVIACNKKPTNLGPSGKQRYNPADFTYNAAEDYYECPQGKRLSVKGTTVLKKGETKRYEAHVSDCRQCPAFLQCMRSKKAQGNLTHGKSILIRVNQTSESLCAQMRKKMERVEYQDIYAQRIQIVEPVFANLRHCKGLNRFTLRGKDKVNGQWLLYCMVHNLGKCLNGRNALKNAA